MVPVGVERNGRFERAKEPSIIQGIFQDLEHGGCQPTLGGSLPFPSPFSFPFPLPPLPLSPSFPPEAGGGVVRKLGGINPPEGVWETPWYHLLGFGCVYFHAIFICPGKV